MKDLVAKRHHVLQIQREQSNRKMGFRGIYIEIDLNKFNRIKSNVHQYQRGVVESSSID